MHAEMQRPYSTVSPSATRIEAPGEFVLANSAAAKAHRYAKLVGLLAR
jgi:hypothetical protein